jgi:predicted nuclease of restriction endonuclease-like (RecB) superfamily
MTKKFGWSKNVLIHQIENQTYEKTLLSQTNFDQTLPEPIRSQAKLAVKDEYTFDFLELGDEYSERQLQQEVLAKIEPFLREMGGVFAFVGSNHRLEISDKEYFIDFLLKRQNHRRVCFERYEKAHRRRHLSNCFNIAARVERSTPLAGTSGEIA